MEVTNGQSVILQRQPGQSARIENGRVARIKDESRVEIGDGLLPFAAGISRLPSIDVKACLCRRGVLRLRRGRSQEKQREQCLNSDERCDGGFGEHEIASIWKFNRARIMRMVEATRYPVQGVFWLLSGEYFAGTPLEVGGS